MTASSSVPERTVDETVDEEKVKHLKAYLYLGLLTTILLLGLSMVAIPLSNAALLALWYWFPAHVPMWFVYPFESFILNQMMWVGAVIVGVSLPFIFLEYLRLIQPSHKVEPLVRQP